MGVRAFLTLVVAITVTSVAQGADKGRRIGLLGVATHPATKASLLAGLREQGLSDVTLLDRSNLTDYGELRQAAQDLVREDATVIVAFGAAAPMAAHEITKTIPIIAVFGDPVILGLAKSYSRPGGNVTGSASIYRDLYPKDLELLHEILPNLKVLAVLLNPGSFSETQSLAAIREKADRLNIVVQAIEVRKPQDFEGSFIAAKKAKCEALLIVTSTTFAPHIEKIAALALKYRMPSIAADSDYIGTGVMVVYGPSRLQIARRAAAYVARAIKGQTPAEMPIEQPTEYQLVINEKTAATLGVRIPQAMRVRATSTQ